ncbi:MAG: glycosyltransferase family 39 protein [Leptospiraceae bacterium]|nr:glycosyltransferase family 39 protein [Leptospiraceae bacterium]
MNRKNLPLIWGIFYFLCLNLITLIGGGYGIFVDEYYYLACAKRIAAGYIDHPPLSVFFLYALGISGDSIFSLRLLPTISAGLTVFLTGSLVEKWKGDSFSITLASISVMTIPVLQVLFGFYSMNAFEVLFVVGLVYFLTKVSENNTYLTLIGIIAGVGILNKHTFIVYFLAITVPFFLLNGREYLLSKWLWFGALLSIIIVSPNLYWLYQNNFSSLAFYKGATSKNINLPYLQILLDQILSQNPATLPIWISGIIFYFRKKEFRFIAIAYLILLFLLLATRSSRPDRIAAIYPVLLAGGVILINPLFKKILMALILLVGIVLAPVSLPILSPETASKYVNFLGIVPEIEKGKKSGLPQWFGDRMDWKNLADAIEESTKKLSSEEKQNSIIVANFYGHASSLEYYKSSIPVVSGHNSYFLWQNEITLTPQNYILIGKERFTNWKDYFEEVSEIGTFSRRFTKEQNIPIYLARRPRISKEELFGKLKDFR